LVNFFAIVGEDLGDGERSRVGQALEELLAEVADLSLRISAYPSG